MTGTVFDLKKFALHDGPGIRTTVFFQGCPLNCKWCHNPESRGKIQSTGCFDSGASKLEPNLPCRQLFIGPNVNSSELFREIIKDEPFFAQSGGGVTFSGGEPMMQADFLAEILHLCRDENIHTAVDSSGYAEFSEFEKLAGLVDLYLFDLKLIDDVQHQKYVGVSNRLILDNLTNLDRAREQINIRIPLIPGITDTTDNLSAILEFINQLRSVQTVTLLPFNQLAIDKYRRYNISGGIAKAKTQPPERLEQIALPFSSAGYDVLIGG